MSSKRINRRKNAKNFLNKHLDRIYDTIQKINDQIVSLYETIYQEQNNTGDNDNNELLQEVIQLEEEKEKLMSSSNNILLHGHEWLKILTYDADGYYYTTKGGDTYYVYPFRQASLDPNTKYRLGFWVGGEVTLFPIYKKRVSLSVTKIRRNRKMSREEKRDGGLMPPSLFCFN